MTKNLTLYTITCEYDIPNNTSYYVLCDKKKVLKKAEELHREYCSDDNTELECKEELEEDYKDCDVLYSKGELVKKLNKRHTYLNCTYDQIRISVEKNKVNLDDDILVSIHHSQ